MYGSTLDDRALGVREAYEALEIFSRDYGRNPLILLMHASVPETLRPDLLALIRQNFMASNAHDASLDADVLFSPLALPLGNGYYRIDAQVRWHCLAMLRSLYRDEPRSRARRVAELLWRYVEERTFNSSRATDARFVEFLDIQRWVALAFLEPASTAHAFAEALSVASDPAAAGPFLRLGGLASAIELPLGHEYTLIAYARGLDALVQGDDKEADRLLSALGDVPVRVGAIELTPPREFLARHRRAGAAASMPTALRAGDLTDLIASDGRLEELAQFAGSPDSEGAKRAFQGKAWQLLVSEDDTASETLMLKVEAALLSAARPAHVRLVRSISEGDDLLARIGTADCTMVVLKADGHKESTIGDFIGSLRKQPRLIPVICLVDRPNARLSDITSNFEAVGLIVFDGRNTRELSQMIDRLSQDSGVREIAIDEVDFNIFLSNVRGSYEIRRAGRVAARYAGALDVDASKIPNLVELSRDVDTRMRIYSEQQSASPKAWTAALERLSRELHRTIFEVSESNRLCWRTFQRFVEDAGGLARTRVRISVDDTWRNVLVDALHGLTHASDDLMALQAPVSRIVQTRRKSAPIFDGRNADTASINCLIIEGEAGGGIFSNSKDALAPLHRLAAEPEAITAILRSCGFKRARRHGERQPSPHSVGWFDHLRISDIDGDAVRALDVKLNEMPWHFIHYCGHVIDSTRHPSALALRGTESGLLPLEALLGRHEGPRFLFVSSADGGSRAVLEAAGKIMPAVLGFRWPVPEGDLLEFAKTFYGALLADPQGAAHKDIEVAFLQARLATRRTSLHATVWAAAALSMSWPAPIHAA